MTPAPAASPVGGGVLGAHAAVLAAALLFGTTFVVVRDAVAEVAVVPFLAVRFLVGAAVLAPFALAPGRDRDAARAGAVGARSGVVGAGVVCGLVLLAGYLFQTAGLQYTTAPVSAFVTYLLVVIVPVISSLVLRRRPGGATSAGVVVAAAGLVLLTGEGAGVGRGELLTLGCAVAFAVHIVLLAELAPRHDTVRLTAVQLLVVGALCAVPGLFLGGYAFPAEAWLAAAFTGAAVSALAFSLQVWGQRRVGPTRTSLLLMLEPVAAAALGHVTGERLGARGVAAATGSSMS
ncbi:MAG TPA: DMT family transporter, partial [Acidimicrobiales bacterium]|nr:DMT family transporter [Acidimicrobiales bacterium]